MKANESLLTDQEKETIVKLTQAYREDEGLPQELAEARALAEVNRQAGRSDDAFDADPQVTAKPAAPE